MARAEMSKPSKMAQSIPLCYPDNFKWDRDNGVLVKGGSTRSKLVVCEDALEILRSIDGPICPIAVTGPARTGKSYIASQLIEPRPIDCVFTTSNKMKASTMGIWMCTEVFKKTLENGTEVTVIVLDTEGLGAYDAYKSNDMQLFALMCLLSSLLVYNCRGVMSAEDIKQLSLVGTLDKVLQGSKEGGGSKSLATDFINFFPNFMWLIRDVTLEFTITRKGKEETVGAKEYILQEVLKIEKEDYRSDEKIKESNRLRRVLLTSFPVFDAMKLTMPSGDPKVMSVMNKGFNRNRLSQIFLDGIDEFVSRCESLMKPKKAWPYVGNIHGKQFAKLVKQYVSEFAINSDELFIHSAVNKVMESLLNEAEELAFIEYRSAMDSFAKSALPCPNHEILNKHRGCLFKAMKVFRDNTQYINDAALLHSHTHHLEERIALFSKDSHACISGHLQVILESNDKKSDAFCKQLVKELIEENVRPLITPFGSPKPSADLNTAIQKVEKLYKERARGPQMLHVYKTLLAEEIIKFTKAASKSRSSNEDKNKELNRSTKIDVLTMEKEELKKKEEFKQQILETKHKVEENIRKAMQDDVARQQSQSSADNKERHATVSSQIKMLFKTHAGLAKELQNINAALEKEHRTSIKLLNKKTQMMKLSH
ncbi:guanylate-binding protein 2-like [Ptychodera flava]|uniref:guanylate-binding protein 2-like n=1 Tax=Ptychodera flava TaxID=63121 RepID=UPI00396A6A14